MCCMVCVHMCVCVVWCVCTCVRVMCMHLCGKIPCVVSRQAFTLLADAGLELTTLLPCPPECWDCRFGPPPPCYVLVSKDVLPGSSTFKPRTKVKVCTVREQIHNVPIIHLPGSLAPPLLCCSGTGYKQGCLLAQHSNSSMTSMTIVLGPVRIRLLTVR